EGARRCEKVREVMVAMLVMLPCAFPQLLSTSLNFSRPCILLGTFIGLSSRGKDEGSCEKLWKVTLVMLFHTFHHFPPFSNNFSQLLTKLGESPMKVR